MKKTVISIISFLLILGIVGAIVGVTWTYTNGFNEDFKTFYIEHNGERILKQKSSMEFEAGTTVRFDVGYTFDIAQSEPRDYSVQIVPNVDENFDYFKDSIAYSWSRVGEISEWFSLKKESDYFEFTIPTVSDMRELLNSSFTGLGSVSLPAGFQDNREFFTLRVSSFNEAVIFDVNFSISYVYIDYVQVIWNIQLSNGLWIGSRILKDWIRGEVIGDFRPDLNYNVSEWYIDDEFTELYDFSKPLTEDLLNLYGKEEV